MNKIKFIQIGIVWIFLIVFYQSLFYLITHLSLRVNPSIMILVFAFLILEIAMIINGILLTGIILKKKEVN